MVAISRTWRKTVVVPLLAWLAVWMSSGMADAGRKNRSKRAEPPTEVQDALRYLPDGCRAVGTINFAALRDNPVLKRLLDKNKNAYARNKLEEELGVDLNQLERLTFGTLAKTAKKKDNQAKEAPYVMVLKLNPEGLAQDVLTRLQQDSPEPLTKQTDGPFTLHIRPTPKPWACFFPADRTMVCGTPELVQAVLTRNVPSVLSPELTRASHQLNPSQVFSLAVVLSDVVDASDATKVFPSDILDGMESIVLQLDGASGLQLRGAVLCRDATIAYQLKGMFSAYWMFVQTMVNQAGAIEPEGAEFLDSVEYAVSDGNFVIQCAIPASVVSAGKIDTSGISTVRVTNLHKLFSCEVPLSIKITPYATPVTPPATVAPSSYATPVYGPSTYERSSASVPVGKPPAPTRPTFDPYSINSDGRYPDAVAPQRVPPPASSSGSCPKSSPPWRSAYTSPPGPAHAPPRSPPCNPPPGSTYVPSGSPYPPPSSPYASPRPYVAPAPCPPTPVSPGVPASPPTEDLQTQLEDARKEIESLRQRNQRFERRLQLAKQDRDMVEQRVDLYRKQLEHCEQELDACQQDLDARSGQPGPQFMFLSGSPARSPQAVSRSSRPQDKPPDHLSDDKVFSFFSTFSK